MGRIRGKAVICEEGEGREKCGQGRENSMCSDLGKSLMWFRKLKEVSAVGPYERRGKGLKRRL